MFMPAAMLLTVTTTGTSTYTRAQDPYCYFGQPLWKEPPADPLADALKAADAAGNQLSEDAKIAARAVLNLLASLPDPTVAIEDQEITLEWYRDRHHVAVVAVDGQSISWAIMAGPANPKKGKKPFDSRTLPAEADNAISSFAAA
jgi:hypothetical protein